jgi:hypothetical protein
MKKLILFAVAFVISVSSFAQHTVRMKGFVVFSDSSAMDEVIVSFSKEDEILSINDVSDLTKVKKVFIQLSNGSKKKNDELSVGNSIVKHKIFVQGVLDFSSLESIKRGMRNEVIWVHSYNNLRNGQKIFVGKRFKSASQSGMIGLALPIVGSTVGILSGGTIPIIVGGVVGLVLQFDAWSQVNKAGAELDDHLKTLYKK